MKDNNRINPEDCCVLNSVICVKFFEQCYMFNKCYLLPCAKYFLFEVVKQVYLLFMFASPVPNVYIE